MKPPSRIWLSYLCFAGTLIASLVQATEVDNTLLTRDPGGAHWAGYSRSFDEQRYSPLTQINASNVKRLGLAWTLELNNIGNVSTAPLAVDGVIYFAAGLSVVHAVDARTGKLLWRHDPDVAKVAGEKLREAWGIRGLAFWKGKVYAGTQDGRLIALDASNGRLLWSVMTVGKDDQRYITGAPRVFNGKVIIGHGGADFGPVRGYVTAYDAETGKQRWRFHTVPGNPADGFENKAMEMAAQTWTGEWWKHGGGGTVWNAMTYDPEFNRIYLGTGNGAPWNQKIRSPDGGDNLFLCSVVALDADTGEYVWHYQTNPGETWDYNSAMDMVLADLTIEGKPRKVMLHAPKNGFFYVIDRKTGKLISAEKIVKVTWAERIDLATGRPVETPNARYQNGETTIWPSGMGAHNWPPMSFNPDTGLVYIPVRELPGYYNDKGIDFKNWRHESGPHFSTGVNPINNIDPPPDAGTSALLAWDPVQQREVWRMPTPGIFNGGTLTSAGGLVFQGDAAGRFTAHDARNGKVLWSFNLGVGTIAPPITYTAGGKQYVSVLAGWTGLIQALGSLTAQHGWVGREHPRRLLTFALDGKAKLPRSAPPKRPVPLDDPGLALDDTKITQGREIYSDRCVTCHGPAAVAGGYAPDLRASPVALALDALDGVVRQGALLQRGMPQFSEISRGELDALRHYLRARAREDLGNKTATGPGPSVR
ncbi:PQQ-dependent dehydrogenase, methanol/ethanol family [Denitratisoma oestradiolicum]|nr:PQQ-dependent dehydrogenase, methanol/ethanol family [Denitratisoma oestradiolicum]TWO81872.1 PQQ-dependent dehydrogenase, methanol/ethanol family [Denitratisoma oestradiolicum]